MEYQQCILYCYIFVAMTYAIVEDYSPSLDGISYSAGNKQYFPKQRLQETVYASDMLPPTEENSRDTAGETDNIHGYGSVADIPKYDPEYGPHKSQYGPHTSFRNSPRFTHGYKHFNDWAPQDEPRYNQDRTENAIIGIGTNYPWENMNNFQGNDARSNIYDNSEQQIISNPNPWPETPKFGQLTEDAPSHIHSSKLETQRDNPYAPINNDRIRFLKEGQLVSPSYNTQHQSNPYGMYRPQPMYEEYAYPSPKYYKQLQSFNHQEHGVSGNAQITRLISDPCMSLSEGDYPLTREFSRLFPKANDLCGFIKCANGKAHYNACSVGTRNNRQSGSQRGSHGGSQGVGHGVARFGAHQGLEEFVHYSDASIGPRSKRHAHGLYNSRDDFGKDKNARSQLYSQDKRTEWENFRANLIDAYGVDKGTHLEGKYDNRYTATNSIGSDNPYGDQEGNHKEESDGFCETLDLEGFCGYSMGLGGHIIRS